MAHKTSQKLHSNGVTVMVHQDDDGHAYVAFTPETDSFSPIDFTAPSIPEAQRIADEKVRSQGHRCDSGCSNWTPTRTSSLKINVPGNTPMERLTELTRRLIRVPKTEVSKPEKKRRKKKRQP